MGMVYFIITLIIIGVCVLIPYLCVYGPEIVDEVKKKKIAKMALVDGPKQCLMFSELTKGDFVWELMCDDSLATCIVKNVDYDFNYRHEIKFINIELIHPDFRYGRTINIPAKFAKSYEYMNNYTLYKDAKLRHDAIMKKKEAELNMIKTPTKSDINNAVEEVIRNLRDFENKVK